MFLSLCCFLSSHADILLAVLQTSLVHCTLRMLAFTRSFPGMKSAAVPSDLGSNKTFSSEVSMELSGSACSFMLYFFFHSTFHLWLYDSLYYLNNQ